MLPTAHVETSPTLSGCALDFEIVFNGMRREVPVLGYLMWEDAFGVIA
jgi:hypothetical protein